MFGLGKVWSAARRVVDTGLSHLGIVRREYVVEQYLRSGALFGEALSYLYMGQSVDFEKFKQRWAMFERQYAALGYRTISVDDFIEYGGYGVLVDHLLRIRRKIDEPAVLHSDVFTARYSSGFEPAIDIQHLLDGGKAQTGIYRLPTTRDAAVTPTDDEKPVWIVWRQDDNGNKAEVGRRNTEAEAKALAAEFEARGHKQMYWVEGPTTTK